jgi:hypothetical protein
MMLLHLTAQSCIADPERGVNFPRFSIRWLIQGKAPSEQRCAFEHVLLSSLGSLSIGRFATRNRHRTQGNAARTRPQLLCSASLATRQSINDRSWRLDDKHWSTGCTSAPHHSTRNLPEYFKFEYPPKSLTKISPAFVLRESPQICQTQTFVPERVLTIQL